MGLFKMNPFLLQSLAWMLLHVIGQILRHEEVGHLRLTCLHGNLDIYLSLMDIFLSFMDPTRKLQDGLSRRWQFGPNDGFLGCDEEMDGPGTFQFWKLKNLVIITVTVIVKLCWEYRWKSTEQVNKCNHLQVTIWTNKRMQAKPKQAEAKLGIYN